MLHSQARVDQRNYLSENDLNHDPSAVRHSRLFRDGNGIVASTQLPPFLRDTGGLGPPSP